MEPGTWILVGALVVALTFAIGRDIKHRPRREYPLALTNRDTVRARIMSRYYLSNHGTEW